MYYVSRMVPRRLVRIVGIAVAYTIVLFALNGILVGCVSPLAGDPSVGATDSPLVGEAEEGLRRALDYMLTLQRNGAWAQAWSPDLTQTYGESKASVPEIIVVRSPGTPAIARTYLTAYEVLGDESCLAAAKQAADCLWDNRRPEGGWDQEFIPGDPGDYRSLNSFDDNTTQGAVYFLADLYRVTNDEMDRARLVESANFLLTAQHESGGWSQAYPLRGNYRDHLTLNDNVVPDIINTLFYVSRVLDDSGYYDAAMRGVEWLLEAQLPEPYAGWAQQYDRKTMKPAYARDYEWPSVSAGETAGVMRCLLNVYLDTGDERLKDAVDRAANWLHSVRLPNRQWARFYTLETNEPLYVSADFKRVYSAAEGRPGYAWEGDFASGILGELAFLEEVGCEEYKRLKESRLLSSSGGRTWAISESQRDAALESSAKSRVRSLDSEGRWLKSGRIDSGRFSSYASVILEYLQCNKTKN